MLKVIIPFVLLTVVMIGVTVYYARKQPTQVIKKEEIYPKPPFLIDDQHVSFQTTWSSKQITQHLADSHDWIPVNNTAKENQVAVFAPNGKLADSGRIFDDAVVSHTAIWSSDKLVNLLGEKMNNLPKDGDNTPKIVMVKNGVLSKGDAPIGGSNKPFVQADFDKSDSTTLLQPFKLIETRDDAKLFNPDTNAFKPTEPGRYLIVFRMMATSDFKDGYLSIRIARSNKDKINELAYAWTFQLQPFIMCTGSEIVECSTYNEDVLTFSWASMAKASVNWGSLTIQQL